MLLLPLLQLCLQLASLQVVLGATQPAFSSDSSRGGSGPGKHPPGKTIAVSGGSSDAVQKGIPGKLSKTTSSGPSQEDWRLWDLYEDVYRNKYKVSSLHFSIPLPGSSPIYPVPGQNSSGNKKKQRVSNPRVPSSHASSGSGGGSNPLPFAVPGYPNPLANIEPVPGNGQPALAPLEPTPLNPDIPSVDALVAFLNNRFPNGRGHPRSPDVDIRQHLMFWSGGSPRAARAAAQAQNRFVLADLFMSDWRNGFTSPWTTFVRTNPPRTFEDTRPMWQRMGLAMARWAQGGTRFRVFDDESATRVDSTWNAIERPELENRGIPIEFVDVNGNVRQPIYPPVHQPPNGTGPSAMTKLGNQAPKGQRIPIPGIGKDRTKLSSRTVQTLLRRDLALKLAARRLRRSSRDEELALIKRMVKYARDDAARTKEAFEIDDEED